MGPKITVDSSTLMNKGLEVIEAHELFGIDYDRIEVVVHPQSVVHSMVEFVDGATIAQLSQPDMRLPIGYAMGWPERLDDALRRHRLVEPARRSTFEPPDRSVFACLDLAYQAGRPGGAAPAWLNAANEVAVAAFLAGRLAWLGSPRWWPRPSTPARTSPIDSVERRAGGRPPGPRRAEAGGGRAGGRRRERRRPRMTPGAADGARPAAARPVEPRPAGRPGRRPPVERPLGARRRWPSRWLTVVAALRRWPGWATSLLIVIVAIIVMVMVHELGHFATAKWSRMKVTEYFVGFGPRLWSVRRGETEYGVKAIPAGGYVKIPGMTQPRGGRPGRRGPHLPPAAFHNRIIVAWPARSCTS